LTEKLEEFKQEQINNIMETLKEYRTNSTNLLKSWQACRKNEAGECVDSIKSILEGENRVKFVDLAEEAEETLKEIQKDPKEGLK
jgi:hypothetical protein